MSSTFARESISDSSIAVHSEGRMERQLLTPKAAQPETAKRLGKRLRGSIYKDRQVVSLRLPEGLHADLQAFADEQQVVLNTYILGLVEADLAVRRKLSRAKVGKSDVRR